MLERSVAAASNDLDSDHNASNDEEQQRVHLGGWYTTSQPSSMYTRCSLWERAGCAKMTQSKLSIGQP